MNHNKDDYMPKTKDKKKERKLGGGRMDGRKGQGERWEERKEGTEALGSFDLWSLWLHSAQALWKPPRTVVKPCPALPALASATTPQEVTEPQLAHPGHIPQL